MKMDNDPDKEKYFYSNDLNFVTACLVKGIVLRDYYREGSVTFFVLESPDKCAELEKQWLNNQLEGLLQEYSQINKRLKGIVHG